MNRALLLSISSSCVIFAAALACGETDGASPGSSSSDEAGSKSGYDAGTSATDAAPADGAVITKKDATSNADSATTCAAGTDEGDPCSTPGAFCHPSSACTDPCQFCNVLTCTNGKWERLEAFPLPQSECADSFPCGALTCQHGQFCLVRYAGVALADGGSAPPNHECTDLPSTCQGGCSCANQAAQGISSCQAQTCTATDGGPVVPCYGI